MGLASIVFENYYQDSIKMVSTPNIDISNLIVGKIYLMTALDRNWVTKIIKILNINIEHILPGYDFINFITFFEIINDVTITEDFTFDEDYLLRELPQY